MSGIKVSKFCNAGKVECRWFCGLPGFKGGSCHTMTYRKGYEHTYEFEQCPFPSKIEPPEKKDDEPCLPLPE